MKRAVTIGILALSLAGPALAQPPMPYGPIPPPRYEPLPPPPGDRYVWEPGHWHWNGVQYVWIGGRYVIRLMRYHHWVDGRWIWSPQAGSWVWRPAHWE
jgi:hypothetical protein